MDQKLTVREKRNLAISTTLATRFCRPLQRIIEEYDDEAGEWRKIINQVASKDTTGWVPVFGLDCIELSVLQPGRFEQRVNGQVFWTPLGAPKNGQPVLTDERPMLIASSTGEFYGDDQKDSMAFAVVKARIVETRLYQRDTSFYLVDNEPLVLEPGEYFVGRCPSGYRLQSEVDNTAFGHDSDDRVKFMIATILRPKVPPPMEEFPRTLPDWWSSAARRKNKSKKAKLNAKRRRK